MKICHHLHIMTLLRNESRSSIVPPSINIEATSSKLDERGGKGLSKDDPPKTFISLPDPLPFAHFFQYLQIFAPIFPSTFPVNFECKNALQFDHHHSTFQEKEEEEEAKEAEEERDFFERQKENRLNFLSFIGRPR